MEERVPRAGDGGRYSEGSKNLNRSAQNNPRKILQKCAILGNSTTEEGRIPSGMARGTRRLNGGRREGPDNCRPVSIGRYRRSSGIVATMVGGGRRHNPVGVGGLLGAVTQGRRCANPGLEGATPLGLRQQFHNRSTNQLDFHATENSEEPQFYL